MGGTQEAFVDDLLAHATAAANFSHVVGIARDGVFREKNVMD